MQSWKIVFLLLCSVFVAGLFASYRRQVVSQANTLPLVLINEFDYDQPGTDMQEFIELVSTTSESLDLSSYSLSLINGDTGVEYKTVSLAGKSILPGEFFVICDSPVVPHCTFDALSDSNAIQNGPADAILLLLNDVVVDAVCYGGGVVLPQCSYGTASTFDSSSIGGISMARYPSGYFSGVVATDFSLLCSSPGVANGSIPQEQCGLVSLATLTATPSVTGTIPLTPVVTETLTATFSETPTTTFVVSTTFTQTPTPTDVVEVSTPTATQSNTVVFSPTEETPTGTSTSTVSSTSTATISIASSTVTSTVSPTKKVSSGGGSHHSNDTSPIPSQSGLFSARWLEQYVQGERGVGMSREKPVLVSGDEDTIVITRFRNTGETTWHAVDVGLYVQTDIEATEPSFLRNAIHYFFGQEIFATTMYGMSYLGKVPRSRASWLQEQEVQPGDEGTFIIPLRNSSIAQQFTTPGEVYRRDFALAYRDQWINNEENGSPNGRAWVWVPVSPRSDLDLRL